jgi:biuret amidohydrolase
MSTQAAHGPILDAPLDLARTALVVTDPQNDFLREDGVAHGLLASNMKELGTIDNIEALLRAAKARSITVAISPHFYFGHDEAWLHPGALQRQLAQLRIFRRASSVDSRGLESSGADFFDRYKPYINDGRTIVTSPHKVFGPESNDLILQLRNRDIDTVILAGMAANLCTESHLRALVESGFRVYMVMDAVGAPGREAYNAAVVNCSLIANGVWTTREAVAAME